MSKQELIKQIEALKSEAKKLEKKINSMPDGKKKPHWMGMFDCEGSPYYMGAFDLDLIYAFCDSDLEKNVQRGRQGMCETKHEVKFVQRYMEAKRRVIDLLLEKNGGDVNWIDWYNTRQKKWMLSIDHQSGALKATLYVTYQYRQPWFYARSKEIWLEVIEELGEYTVKLALFPDYKPKT